jgi:hypothetical protein
MPRNLRLIAWRLLRDRRRRILPVLEWIGVEPRYVGAAGSSKGANGGDSGTAGKQRSPEARKIGTHHYSLRRNNTPDE